MVYCVKSLLSKFLHLRFLVCFVAKRCLKRFTMYGHYAGEVDDITIHPDLQLCLELHVLCQILELKGPFIATQLNSTSSGVELRRYKRAFKLRFDHAMLKSSWLCFFLCTHCVTLLYLAVGLHCIDCVSTASRCCYVCFCCIFLQTSAQNVFLRLLMAYLKFTSLHSVTRPQTNNKDGRRMPAY